jgi:hypothetical protein
MKTETRLITPNDAKRILQKNSMNRKIEERLVNFYCKLMIAGLWKEDTGEAIKIALNGYLLDGQHRLLALIKANISLSFLMVLDLDAEIFAVLDSGKTRSAADVFSISQIEYGAPIAAGIKKYILLKRSVRNNSEVSKRDSHISSPELLASYNARMAFWKASATMAGGWYSKFQRILTPSELIGYYAYFYDISQDEAFTFLDSLCTGTNLDSYDPIKLLREKLIFYKTNQKFSLAKVAKVAYIFKTWNLFREKKNIKVLKFHMENELFPVPK